VYLASPFSVGGFRNAARNRHAHTIARNDARRCAQLLICSADREPKAKLTAELRIFLSNLSCARERTKQRAVEVGRCDRNVQVPTGRNLQTRCGTRNAAAPTRRATKEACLWL
jgi:hypothetical protein